jgi:predicted glycosyltransferase involved in capsule biosynthesis
MHRLLEEEMYLGVLKVGYTVYENDGRLVALWDETLLEEKIVYGFSQTEPFILFYLDDDVYRSLDNHQTIFTELRIRYMQCK